MGLNYSYNLWVPHKSLYNFFSRLAQLDGSFILSQLIWPDGRRLAGLPPAPESGLIPFDTSIGDDNGLCLGFRFEIDTALIQYDFEIQQNGIGLTARQDDGRFPIACIWTYVHLSPEDFRWLGSDPLYIEVKFRAATTRMSLLFSQSKSIRHFFIQLARQSEAIYCTFDKEAQGVEELFIREISHQLPLECITGYVPEPRLDFGSPESTVEPMRNELVQEFIYCSGFECPPTSAELERIFRSCHSSDAGLRASAYRAIGRFEPRTALPVLEVGLEDTDWRVRTVVANAIGELRLEDEFDPYPAAAVPLIWALNDSHSEVRTVAAGQLRYFNDPVVFANQLRIFETTELIPENLGLVKQVLHGLWMNKAGFDVSAAIGRRLSEPNFPFSDEAQRAIEILLSRLKHSRTFNRTLT
jgi:hypothetical protein